MNPERCFELGSNRLTRRGMLQLGAAAGAAVAVSAVTSTRHARSQESPVADEPQYLVNAAEFVEAADWDAHDEVAVELSEFAFSPGNLTFEAGKPYVLTIRNVGVEKHYFTAADFYRSIATRKAETPQSEVKVPFFTAIEIFPGASAELYFVAVMPGEYEFHCQIEGHTEAGMQGSVTVTGETPTEPAPQLANLSDSDWMLDAADRVDAADWDSMETVSFVLGEYFFDPVEITLTVDRPYKVEIKNQGSEKHEFTASDFYRSVALRKIQDASGEFKAAVLSEVEVFAGQQADLYLIPVEPGEYELVCEIKGHKEQGMVGRIVVAAAA